MKIVIFGSARRVGALVDGRVVDLNRVHKARTNHSAEQAGAEVPFDLTSLIERGEAALQAARAAIDFSRSMASDDSHVFEAGNVRLHAPWPQRRMAMCASNYAAHIAGIQQNSYGRTGAIATVETAAAEMRKLGQFGFFKVLLEVAANGDEIPAPKRSPYFDYEGEAAIIIGKRGKDVKSAEIDTFVWGVTLINDWTIRDPLLARALQYNMNKNFDLSVTMGPCIVVGEADYRNIDVETRVNGQLRQKFNTSQMVFSFGEILEHLTRDFTFVPGDVISGGTGAGTAADTTKPNADGSRPLDRFTKPGDLVEVSSPQIGTISNRVI